MMYNCSNADFSLLYNILLREGVNPPNSHAYIPPDDVHVMHSSRGRSWHNTYKDMQQVSSLHLRVTYMGFMSSFPLLYVSICMHRHMSLYCIHCNISYI